MAETIELERPSEGVAVLTVNDPEVENRLRWSTVDRLGERLTEARTGGARVCVLASAVAGHWLEHACLRDLRAMVTGDPTTGSGVGWFVAQQELGAPEMISIAAISGDCAGGGAELGWACDLRVAEESARFSQPEIRMGLPTGIGGTARLARLIGPTVAAEMVLDGAPLGARRLYELGGVNRVVADGRARETAIEWATRLATHSPAAVSALKQVLHAAATQPLDRALEREQALFQEVVRSPGAVASLERIQARLDAGLAMHAV
jgi:enoyl-CoA hydratase/carnithine racemase